jgi:hypothetical protein
MTKRPAFWVAGVTWAAVAAGIALTLAFPAFADFIGHWNWVLGVVTGWIWRGGLEARRGRAGGPAVERVMAGQARALKRGTRRRFWWRR